MTQIKKCNRVLDGIICFFKNGFAKIILTDDDIILCNNIVYYFLKNVNDPTAVIYVPKNIYMLSKSPVQRG